MNQELVGTSHKVIETDVEVSMTVAESRLPIQSSPYNI